MKDTPAFDIQAVCSGFIYSLQVADTFLKCGNAKNILVIGAETLSKIVDWEDRRTCVLFGDGAGAVIISASKDSRGILATSFIQTVPGMIVCSVMEDLHLIRKLVKLG